MVMTLPALMMMMEVLWNQIGKRMQSFYFANWIVMTMDQNMIEALRLTAWQLSSPATLGVLSHLLFFYHSLLCSLLAFTLFTLPLLPVLLSSAPFSGFRVLLSS